MGVAEVLLGKSRPSSRPHLASKHEPLPIVKVDETRDGKMWSRRGMEQLFPKKLVLRNALKVAKSQSSKSLRASHGGPTHSPPHVCPWVHKRTLPEPNVWRRMGWATVPSLKSPWFTRVQSGCDHCTTFHRTSSRHVFPYYHSVFLWCL